MAGAGEDPREELRHEVVGLALSDQRGVLGGGDVGLGDPVGDPERRADLVAGALVVGVRVGERVRADLVAVEVGENALARALGARVDEHVAEQERVDPVRQEERVQVPDVGGEFLQSGADGARTRDLVAASHALSQLSYSPRTRDCSSELLADVEDDAVVTEVAHAEPEVASLLELAEQRDRLAERDRERRPAL